MEKNAMKNTQNAQGMVEFALVLPILLLLILGIIGFGHLFFVYSATVSASREAARFGAAVGVTQNDIPHFQDCNEIRAAAIRAGLFAGVENTANSVNISYDKGPGTTATDPLTSCPVNGTGPDVELGDRIIIQINIQYNSIVPIANIPSFPLTATTRRTIVRSLQIGEAPTAEPVCPTTQIFLTIMEEDSASHTKPSVVGQEVPIEIDVAAETAPHPTTEDGLYLIDSTDPTVWSQPQQVFDAPSGAYSYTYMHAGNYYISGQYVGDIIQCFEDSSLSNQLHVVDPASTSLTITSPADGQSFEKPTSNPVQILFSVNLAAVAPGARSTWAGVTVTIRDHTNPTNSCNATLNASGDGSCSLSFSSIGGHLIDAEYAGDADYLPSSASVGIIITEPTLVPTPVPTLVPTVPAPKCPIVTAMGFNDSGAYWNFSLTNTENAVLNITSLEITWPSDPIVQLKEIRYDFNYIGNTCWNSNKNRRPACIWYNQNSGDNPPNFTITGNPVTNGDLPIGYTQEMRMVFSANLSSIRGLYRAVMQFDNGCTTTVEYTKQ